MLLSKFEKERKELDMVRISIFHCNGIAKSLPMYFLFVM